MAVGPFARILAQVVVPIVAVLARAIPAAYGQALNNARKAGVDATEAAAPVFGKRITRSEALQVLNITEQEIKADPKIVQKVSFGVGVGMNGGGDGRSMLAGSPVEWFSFPLDVIFFLTHPFHFLFVFVPNPSRHYHPILQKHSNSSVTLRPTT